MSLMLPLSFVGLRDYLVTSQESAAFALAFNAVVSCPIAQMSNNKVSSLKSIIGKLPIAWSKLIQTKHHP